MKENTHHQIAIERIRHFLISSGPIENDNFAIGNGHNNSIDMKLIVSHSNAIIENEPYKIRFKLNLSTRTLDYTHN